MQTSQNMGLFEKINSSKAVIFDLDGTLADSMWMWYDIDVEFLGRYGLPCPPDLQHTIEGMSFSEVAVYFKERFSLPETTDEIKEIWTRMSYDKYANEVPLREGALDLLIFLKDKNILTGLATSNGSAMTGAVLRANRVEEYFDCVMTASEVPHGKPAPDIYLAVAARLGVRPEECLVFEDVVAGIRAGKAAGMKVCAVWEKNAEPYRDEIISLSDYYIKDYTELAPLTQL